VSNDDRPLGRRYRLDQPDGTWWELGWDRPLGTFYAQHFDSIPYDPFTADNLLDWHGTNLGELSTVDALARRLPFDVPDAVSQELARDADAFPHVVDPPYLHAATALLDHLDSGAIDEQLAPFENERTGHDQHWTLPAPPLADALEKLRADPYLAAHDTPSFALGLGLDPDLAADVLSGRRDDVTIEEIAEVCEALRCSPYEIWPPEHASGILHAYGPERWPRYIEPLDDGRSLASATEFVRRRVEQQAAAVVTIAPTHEPATTRLVITRYRQTDVLAIDADGRATVVGDATQPAAPGVDYHFAFRSLGEPEPLDVHLSPSSFAAGCPAGQDAHPRLVSVAAGLDRESPGADLIRFADPASGAEQWLGRETPFDPWQTWDDPRLYYPGDPSDVLDHRTIAAIDLRAVAPATPDAPTVEALSLDAF
jgi:hypothetical protein